MKEENIIINKTLPGKLRGKIIKLYFKCKYPNVLVQVENIDHEVIWQGHLDQENKNVYPRKVIEIFDKTELEYFYMHPNTNDTNNLFIEITGLQEGQNIEMLKIVYDDKETVKVIQ